MAQTNRKSKTKKILNPQNIKKKAISGRKAETSDRLSDDDDTLDSGSTSGPVNVVARRKIELYWEKKRLINELGGVENLDDIDFWDIGIR